MLMSSPLPFRKQHWHGCLTNWARGWTGQPFAWGRSDCASLAIGAVRAMAADPRALPPLPKWSTKRQATKAWAKGRTATEWLQAIGAEALPSPRFITPGDLVVHPVGVVVLVSWDQVLRSEPGLAIAAVPLREVQFPGGKAWRLPW